LDECNNFIIKKFKEWSPVPLFIKISEKIQNVTSDLHVSPSSIHVILAKIVIPIISGLQGALYTFRHTSPTVIINEKFAVTILMTQHSTYHPCHNQMDVQIPNKPNSLKLIFQYELVAVINKMSSWWLWQQVVLKGKHCICQVTILTEWL
jgi:hypothetical protein